MRRFFSFELSSPTGKSKPSAAVLVTLRQPLEPATIDREMIRQLRVRNLAIVEEFSLELGSGLNVMTGETGAGKSLLIDSLEFLSGARGSSDSVRTGEEKLSAEATFEVPASFREPLEEAGVEPESAGQALQVIVRRELTSTGRGRVLVNGASLAVRELQNLTAGLLEIHGQTESHARIAGRSFLEVIDRYGSTEGLVQQVRDLYKEWKSAAEKLRELRQAHRDRSLKLDLLRFQIDDIASARLESGEEDRLRSERALLAHAQEMLSAASGALTLLDEDEASASSQIARATSLLHPLTRSIAEVEKIASELDDVRFRLDEVVRLIARLAGDVRHDPERLEEIEARLATIERLKRKYGSSVDEVIAHVEASQMEFESLSDYEGTLKKLEAEHDRVLAAYEKTATTLSDRRQRSAAALEKSVQNELSDLAMSGTRISISIHTEGSPDSPLEQGGRKIAFGPDGFDRVEVLIAPNRGEDLRPLQRIASGGELSRIQLAIAAALFRSTGVEGGATLVFDEIDAGIGGRVADVVGRKLRELSEKNQLLCVTHLPQIAAMGETHFRVWKEEHDGRTRARIEKLADRQERVEEVARMLGGETVSDSARAHASQLLGPAEEKKARRRSAAVPR